MEAADDVKFTNIKCDPGDPLKYHAIPGDNSAYWQCGPGGFYWTLPCAPGSAFSQEHQACVWQGEGPIPNELLASTPKPEPPATLPPVYTSRPSIPRKALANASCILTGGTRAGTILGRWDARSGHWE